MSARFEKGHRLRRLRENLRGNSGDSVGAATGVFDTFARNIDVAALDAQQFMQLLETLHTLDRTGAGYELRGLATGTLAEIVRNASKEQLRALEQHGELRWVFVNEIFRRMTQHFRPDRAAEVDLVLSWRFTDGTGPGGYDRYQTVIENGRCVSGADLGREQDTTLTMCVADFVRLATGNANVATMFMTGRVRVKGEYTPAVRFSGYFDMPKPG